MRTACKTLASIGLYLALLAMGCTDILVYEDRKTATDIKVGEKISFILDRSSIKDVEEAQEMEEKMEACIEEALNKLEPPVETVSAETFRKTAFPGIDYLVAPSSLESLTTLLQSASFRERINVMGLRYLLILDSEFTSKVDPQKSGCGGGGGACLLVWDNETKMSATIFDLKQNYSAGKVKSQADGHPWIIFIDLIFPLGFPAFTESPACNALGQQVATFIAGNRQQQ